MTLTEFVNKLKDFCINQPTLYVRGGFGQQLTDYYKDYFIKNYSFNRSIDAYGRDRAQKIKAASPDTYAFDCVCFIKSVINGSKGYTTSPCPDITIKDLLNKCNNVRQLTSSQLPNIGDFLTWADFSHCGVYVGDGKVAECTYRWKDGVQLTDYVGRGWYYAGKLPYIDNDMQPDIPSTIPAIQICACRSVKNIKDIDGTKIFKVSGWYKQAFTFSTMEDAKNNISTIRKKYGKDCFITEYKADTLYK